MNKKHHRKKDIHIKKSYEKPKITTYTEDKILDMIGPANTGGSPMGHAYGHGHNHGHGHGH